MTDSANTTAPVVVIGGGISGLACAFRLKKRGISVLLLEKSNRFGGVVESKQQDGFLFESGPQSFLLTSELAELIEDAGLGGDLISAPPRLARYILHGGKLVSVPLSPFSLLSTSLLDDGTKWRLLTEVFRKTRPPDPDESISAFTRRKFGECLLENLVAPFVSGVYAGDPEQLSLRSSFPQVHEWEEAKGSVLRGAIAQMKRAKKSSGKRARRQMCSLKDGVGTLMKALGSQLGDSARLGSAVNSVRPISAGGRMQYEVSLSTGETKAAHTIVFAADAVAGPILMPVSAQFPATLGKIAYAPVAVYSAGYRQEAIGRPLDGFGFLVPRKEGMRTLGCVWNSSLFPARAPKGHVLMTSFAGGATDPEFCTRGEERIASTIRDEIARALNIREAPVIERVRVHARALPQYTLGYSGIILELKTICDTTPEFYLTGNYLDGPALGACVVRAFRIADEVEARLSGATKSGA